MLAHEGEPFVAVVGADDMALALVLTSIAPEVGGVLVRGEKGTAKSTIVRALVEVLPWPDGVEWRIYTSVPARHLTLLGTRDLD